MNATSKARNVSAPRAAVAGDRLSSLERALLIIPVLYFLVLGVLMLFAPTQFAALFGYSLKNLYLYALVGAVTVGYLPGLVFAILQGEWSPVRIVIISLLVFGVASLFGIAVAFVTGQANSFAYLMLIVSVLIIGMSAWMLNAHRDGSRLAPDTGAWLKYLVIFLTIAAFGTGTLFTLAPAQVSQLFGFNGTDELVFRFGGAATLGFAVMGVIELRNLSWREIRIPSLNALMFNGVGLVATVLSILRGDPILLLLVILLVNVVATVGYIIALQRQGK